jgi:hypothetical protein
MIEYPSPAFFGIGNTFLALQRDYTIVIEEEFQLRQPLLFGNQAGAETSLVKERIVKSRGLMKNPAPATSKRGVPGSEPNVPSTDQKECAMRYENKGRKLTMLMMTAALLALCVKGPAKAAEKGKQMSFTLTSSEFRNMESIPAKFTCEGENISPPLSWAHLPGGTKSLVLIMDDPDAPDPAAPKITWIHWVLYNIPPSMNGLEEGAGNRAVGNGILEGVGSRNKSGYGGPCPPVGTHRYFHKLYALDTVLPALHSPSKAELERAMKGHVLGEAVLIGTYRKTKP